MALVACGGESGPGGGPPDDKAPSVRTPSTPPPSLGAGFVDLTPPDADLLHPPPPRNGFVYDVVGFFADLDGDGKPEVINTLTRLLPPGHDNDPLLAIYKYDDHGLTLSQKVTDAAQLPKAYADVDGDGLLDRFASDGLLNICWGLAPGKFGDRVTVDKARPLPQNQPPSYAGVGFDDIDRDGWLDILLSGSGCVTPNFPNIVHAPVHVLLRDGLRNWTLRDDLVDATVLGQSDQIFTIPDKEAPLVISISKECSPHPLPPLSFRFSGGAYHAITYLPFYQDAPGSPMGASAGDLDGDGKFEVAFTTDFRHELFTPDGDVTRDISREIAFWQVPSDRNIPMGVWTMAMLDIDRDGRLDMVSTHGNDDGGWNTTDPTYVGPQYTTIHWNGGGLAFAAVQSGLEVRGQWKALAVGDLDADGDPDLIVGGAGEPAHIFHNEVQGGHGLSLRLHGTTSNSLGIGAIVDVWATPSSPMQRHLCGNMAVVFNYNEPLVFIGLGDATAASRISIQWPSGTVQELTDVQSGQLVDVTEPPVVALAPAARHLPADGTSVATIHVTPVDKSGAPRAARVAVSIAGPGTLGAPTQKDLAWDYPLTAPSAAGSTVITVTIDDVPVPLRPRFWWD